MLQAVQACASLYFLTQGYSKGTGIVHSICASISRISLGISKRTISGDADCLFIATSDYPGRNVTRYSGYTCAWSYTMNSRCFCVDDALAMQQSYLWGEGSHGISNGNGSHGSHGSNGSNVRRRRGSGGEAEART